MANERARALRKNMTAAELRLWQELRQLRSQGFHFRRQVPMGRYVIDFCCHGSNLVIEVDGGQHADEDQKQKDLDRTAWLEQEGYRVIRFWNNDVIDNLSGVMDAIMKVLQEHPTPTPPHRGEGLAESQLPVSGR